MLTKNFMKLVNSAKPCLKTTGTMGIKAYIGSKDLLKINLRKRDKLPSEISVNGIKYFRKDQSVSLMIEFNKPHQLTIFESEMLWLLLVENKRCADYGNYHNCPAGQEFIKNIKYMEVQNGQGAI